MEMVAQRLDTLSGRKLNQQLGKCQEVVGHYLHEQGSRSESTD